MGRLRRCLLLLGAAIGSIALPVLDGVGMPHTSHFPDSPALHGRSLASSRASSSVPSGAAPPRIILTTRGITDDDAELSTAFNHLLHEAAAGEDPRIAVITTAKLAPCASCGAKPSSEDTQRLEQGNGYDNDEQPPHPPQSKEAALENAKEANLESAEELSMRLGARVRLIDCAQDSAESMQEVLRQSHAVYVLGGNTFYLLYHMRRSGLDVLIRRRVLDEGLLYVGCSAGAIVAGRSISTAFWKGWDDPHVVDTDWSEPHTTAGLELVGASLFPHYDHSRHDALVRRRRAELDHQVVTLGETGCYVVGMSAGGSQLDSGHGVAIWHSVAGAANQKSTIVRSVVVDALDQTVSHDARM